MKALSVLLGLGVSLMSASSPSYGYEMRCVNDQTAVDGNLISVRLSVPDNGLATAYIVEEGNSRVVQYSEKTTIRNLDCKRFGRNDFDVFCDGLVKLNISEMELVNPGNTGFSRKVIVSTTQKNKSFSFKPGPIGKSPTNGCELKN